MVADELTFESPAVTFCTTSSKIKNFTYALELAFILMFCVDIRTKSDKVFYSASCAVRPEYFTVIQVNRKSLAITISL